MTTMTTISTRDSGLKKTHPVPVHALPRPDFVAASCMRPVLHCRLKTIRAQVLL